MPPARSGESELQLKEEFSSFEQRAARCEFCQVRTVIQYKKGMNCWVCWAAGAVNSAKIFQALVLELHKTTVGEKENIPGAPCPAELQQQMFPITTWSLHVLGYSTQRHRV